MSLNITVDGMTCGGCVSAVEKALTGLDAEASVAVDLDSGLVTIQSAVISKETAETAIIDAGFDIRSA